MPELADRLRADQVVSRKSADKDRTLLLGTVLAALKNKEIDLGRPLDDAEVVDVLRKQIKQRQDSIEQYTAGARLDLARQEDAEMQLLLACCQWPPVPEVVQTAAGADLDWTAFFGLLDHYDFYSCFKLFNKGSGAKSLEILANRPLLPVSKVLAPCSPHSVRRTVPPARWRDSIRAISPASRCPQASQ